MYIVEYIFNGNYIKQYGFDSVDDVFEWASEQGLIHNYNPKNEREFKVIN